MEMSSTTIVNDTTVPAGRQMGLRAFRSTSRLTKSSPHDQGRAFLFFRFLSETVFGRRTLPTILLSDI